MWKYTVHVNGMICEKCENNVNDAVRKTFSVKEVTSSYSKNETTVIAENKLDENVLRQVISAAGYQVMSVQLTPMRVKSDIPSESKTMLNVFLSWVSWECTKLPADGAEVQILDGIPPADTLNILGQNGFLEILFCRQGGLLLEFSNGQRLEVKAGQVLFFPGRAGDCRCRFLQEPFQGILVREDENSALASFCTIWPGLENNLPEENHGCTVIEIALWCETLFIALDSLPKERQGNYCVVKALELLYLFHAGKNDLCRANAAKYYDRRQIQTVQAVHDYMLEHLDQQLTIRQMSQQFHISETLLKSCFRQLYGAPVHQYFLERRIARAAQLLCSTEQTVLQISMAVGYGSVSQFGAAFKARYKMSPAQFRKKSKKMSNTACSGPNRSEKHG